MNEDEWWRQPRQVWVVVDNDSWILPHAHALVEAIRADGDHAALCQTHEEIGQGDVAFYLGCVRLTPREVLARNRRNLVVHESDLPLGRGFAPLTWQILEGKNDIPVCLLDMTDEVDAGDLLLREVLRFEGHELNPELRQAQGEVTLNLCLRYLASSTPPVGQAQTGTASFYRRRRPEDSRLDPALSLAEQFPLLRVVDNERYPAFFEHQGWRYRLCIEKIGPMSGGVTP